MQVERLRREYAVEVEWQPFELHPEIPPSGTPAAEIMRGGRYSASDYHERLQSLAEREGIKIVQSTLVPNSRLALESAEFARDAARFDDFHRTLFVAYFERNEDIGDVEVLRRLAEGCDMEGSALVEALATRRYRQRVDERIEWARQRGIDGTPTFIFDDRFQLLGTQEYTVLERIAQFMDAHRIDE